MAKLFIHQIYNDQVTRVSLDPDLLPLDNSANERPDWREYWPIRQYLLTHDLEEGALHGFFSPPFRDKSWPSRERIGKFVTSCYREPDVVILTPKFEWDSTLFTSVFEQGEHMHPGLMAAAEAAFDEIGLRVDVGSLINDSRRTVFSNCFVATRIFWRRWLDINEQLFALAENEASRAGALLRANTAYRSNAGPVQQKVFIMERVASLILASDETLKVESFPPERSFGDASIEAICCDALKIAMRERPDAHYSTTFRQLRDPLLKRLAPEQR